MSQRSQKFAMFHLAVILVCCAGTSCKRSALTFDDIKRPSREFSFESVEVNGKSYKSEAKEIALPKGQELNIKAHFKKDKNPGMVKPGTVKVVRPDGNAILVLQAAWSCPEKVDSESVLGNG